MDLEKLPWLQEWNEKKKNLSLEGITCSSLEHYREPLLGADSPRGKTPGVKCCAWVPPWTPILRIRVPEWPSPALPPPVLPIAFSAVRLCWAAPVLHCPSVLLCP